MKTRAMALFNGCLLPECVLIEHKADQRASKFQKHQGHRVNQFYWIDCLFFFPCALTINLDKQALQLIYSYLDQRGKTKKHVWTTAEVYHSDTLSSIRKQQLFVTRESGHDGEMRAEVGLNNPWKFRRCVCPQFFSLTHNNDSLNQIGFEACY